MGRPHGLGRSLIGPPCLSNTSPCVRPKRPRVCRHHANMLKHMCAWCRYTRGRFERTPGDVLDGHTPHTTHHTVHTHHTTTQDTTPTTQHNMTHHNTPQQHDHNTTRRDRERQRETEKEDRERRQRQRVKRRRNRRRQEKRREKIHFQCGGVWPFLVDVVVCLVHPVNDRVFSLLNRVKYDCSLTSSSASWPVNSFLLSGNCSIFCSYSFQFFF